MLGMAEQLGVDVETEPHLLWIVEEVPPKYFDFGVIEERIC